MSQILNDKIQYSIELLRKAEKIALAYDRTDGFYLAFSGGKDSQALYHIAKLAGVKFKAHFSPTTIDPPQVIRFIRTHCPDVQFEKLHTNIYDLAIKKKSLPTQVMRWCCKEFKEGTGSGKVTLIGIRAAESIKRSKRCEVEMYTRSEKNKFSGTIDQFEEWRVNRLKSKSKPKPSLANPEAIDNESITGCIRGKDSLLVSPIFYWTDDNVWEFLNDVVKIPHCILYDQGYHRIGCILCPMSQKKQKLKEIDMFPNVKEKWIKSIIAIINGGGAINLKSSRTSPPTTAKWPNTFSTGG